MELQVKVLLMVRWLLDVSTECYHHHLRRDEAVEFICCVEKMRWRGVSTRMITGKVTINKYLWAGNSVGTADREVDRGDRYE